jgi:hypothetical protein
MVVVEVSQRFWRRGSLIYNSEAAAISEWIFVPGKNLPFLSTVAFTYLTLYSGNSDWKLAKAKGSRECRVPMVGISELYGC